MKALILSAGFGTRLLSHTRALPKPLFPIGGRPLLDILIGQLIRAGATGIAVNTHHLGGQIAAFLSQQEYPVPIIIRQEAEILGTGGAIRNFSDFLNDRPFMVINSDVLTDIDLEKVYRYHMSNADPVTLVLHDHPQFNTVFVAPTGCITGFTGNDADGPALAFTGIQVVDPAIHDRIPAGRFVNSIDVYAQMIGEGKNIRGYVVGGHYWNDLGTPERYRDAVIDQMTPGAFAAATGRTVAGPFNRYLLAGDGSDRKWYRIGSEGNTLIIADHGIRTDPEVGEIDAYGAIGDHLHRKGIPVPRIISRDRFSGLVFLEDLGDTLLQEVIAGESNPNPILKHYQTVIDQVAKLTINGAEGFDPAWAYQSVAYDKQLIIEKECQYFTGAFLKGYLGFEQFREEALDPEFDYLADTILAHATTGLMHRDMQSRNIMVKSGRYYFIDFQGARFGPVQYDLASLLIDPYVALGDSLREILLQYAIQTFSRYIMIDPDRFVTGYRYCAVSRSMQALGAFGFLTRVKQKEAFRRYIPVALATLKQLLDQLGDPRLSGLGSMVTAAAGFLADQKPKETLKSIAGSI